MDAQFSFFHQGVPLVHPHPQQLWRPPPSFQVPAPRDDADQRIAHTLTACCRCRQRKTRCDPTLPRCLPCDRSSSTCEYFDTTKGRKVNRNYVVHLQNKVQKLEALLAQYTDEEADRPPSREDIVRPGGMVRLGTGDDSKRYMGPSSGITLMRLLMEDAKRLSEKRRIAEIVPALRSRRADQADRMQSITMTGSVSGPAGRKKSYPTTSEIPAMGFPNRVIIDRLIQVFNDSTQIFTPTLHEVLFLQDVNDVVDNGDKDPYKNFVVHMVLAIGLQKMDIQWAGLADSYYVAAMQYFEKVVRPKDLKTLQCLVLISQYSRITPTQTAVYYISGLATRICQQLGLGDEKTITVGTEDALTIDLRRRLSWIVTTDEFDLAHTMGRPNGFAKGNDLMNVGFFSPAADRDITTSGITPDASPCPRKLVAIHVCKMGVLQAEIRRVLYEKKRPEPTQQDHPWFAQMEQKLTDWRKAAPSQPDWCRPWFTGRFHNMMISLFRPSPQVPNPTGDAALKCVEGASYLINVSSHQVQKGAVDMTWKFMLDIYSALNALLWAVSYSSVRAKHSEEHMVELVNRALASIRQCSQRWPESEKTADLYETLASACLQVYRVKEDSLSPTPSSANGFFGAPASLADPNSPESTGSDNTLPGQPQQTPSLFNTNPFGYVFDGNANSSDMMAAQYAFAPEPSRYQTQFRSNSIFMNPSTDVNGRRFSTVAPELPPPNGATPALGPEDHAPPPASQPPNDPATQMHTAPPTELPTPPDSLAPPSGAASTLSLSPMTPTTGLRSASPTPTPTLHHATPVSTAHHTSPMPMPGNVKQEPSDFSAPPQLHRLATAPLPHRTAAFTIPPHSQSSTQQRSAPPTAVPDWFHSQTPFFSPNAFSAGAANSVNNTNFWAEVANPFTGLGLGGNESTTFGGQIPRSSGPSPAHGGPGNVPPHSALGSGRGGGAGGMGDFAGFPPGGGPLGGPLSHHHGLQGYGDHGRQMSLSHEQQQELMGILEVEGANEIDSWLNTMNTGIGGDISWN